MPHGNGAKCSSKDFHLESILTSTPVYWGKKKNYYHFCNNNKKKQTEKLQALSQPAVP